MLQYPDFNEDDNSIDLYAMAQSMHKLEEQQIEIIIDAIMIGYQLGKNPQADGKIRKQFDISLGALIQANNLIEIGLAKPFAKMDMYVQMLTNNGANLLTLVDNMIESTINSANNPQIMVSQSLLRNQSHEKEQASLSLIKRIQNEEQNEYELQLQARAQEENRQIECPICLDTINYDQLWPLKICGHIYHRNCLELFASNKIIARQFPIVCPQVQCKQQIIFGDLNEILTAELIEQFTNFSFQQFIDTHGDEFSWCPTAGCSYAFISDQSKLDCPLCVKSYCLDCRVAYHNNQSCKEYQINNNFDDNDKKFVEFVKGLKCKQCPQCRFWVERNQGCDHMTCRCKYEFCYKCGGKYKQCACVKK